MSFWISGIIWLNSSGYLANEISFKKTEPHFKFFCELSNTLNFPASSKRRRRVSKLNLASKEGLYSYALLTILASKVWLLVRLVCGWEIFRSDCWGCIFIAFRRLSTQTLSPIRSLLQLCQLGCLRFSRSLKSSSLWKIKDSHLV